MRFKKVIKMFKQGNVCVVGLRGTGKDLLMGNVIARRKQSYISNLDYTDDERYNPLIFEHLFTNNTYENLISGNINFYSFPYEYGTDIYISDSGIYLPSQYCNKLNRDYEDFIQFQALSRQLGRCNVHINTQNLNRLWDKLREQSDIYIKCNGCIYFLGFVIQKITIYEKYQSCVNNVKKCRIKEPLFCSKQAKAMYQTYRDSYLNTHGKIKIKYLFYRNKSKHDTYYFDKLFKGGVMK